MNSKTIAGDAVFFVAAIVAMGNLVIEAQVPVTAQAPQAAGRGNSYLRGPAEKELIYVTLPGTLEGSPDANGSTLS